MTSAANASARFMIDSFLVVSGAKQAPQPGLLVSVGDSWTKGSGAQDTGLAAYPNRLASLLQAKLGRPVTLVRKGDSVEVSTPGGGKSYEIARVAWA